MPDIPTRNTRAVVQMIAEQAADLIRQDELRGLPSPEFNLRKCAKPRRSR